MLKRWQMCAVMSVYKQSFMRLINLTLGVTLCLRTCSMNPYKPYINTFPVLVLCVVNAFLHERFC